MEINEQIVKKIKQNDRKVILDLYKFSFNVLMSAAVRYKNNEEDQMTIVNNSFLKIIQKIEQYKIGTAYLSWIKRIVQNEIIDEFRKQNKYRELFNFEADETQHDEETPAEIDADHDAEMLEKMLNQLPPATKLVFNLYAIEGYTNKEISEKFDISYETVKWHIKEARKKLRTLLNSIQEKDLI